MIETLEVTAAAYRDFEFTTLTDALYRFFWNDYCDWYVEVSKSKLQSPQSRASCLGILDLCLRGVIQMLHPIAPFITEELWQQLGFATTRDAMGLRRRGVSPEGAADAAAGPTAFLQEAPLLTAEQLRDGLAGRGAVLNETAVREVAALQDFVAKVRALKAQYNLAAKHDVTLKLVPVDLGAATLTANRELLLRQGGAREITLETGVENLPSEVTALGTVYLDLAGSVDIEAERKKIAKQLDGLSKAIAGAEAKLANEKFMGSAPEAVVTGVRDSLAANQAKQAELLKLLEGLG